MSQPSAADLMSMDWTFDGEPVVGNTRSGIDVLSMDWTFDGEPFVMGQAFASTGGQTTTNLYPVGM